MTKLDIIKIKVDKFDETIDSLDTRLNRLHWRRKQETINIFKKFMTPDTDGIEIKNISDRRMEFILLNDKYSSMTIERINQEDLERASWDDTLVDFKAYSNGLSLKNVEELKKRSELQVKLAEQFEDFKDDKYLNTAVKSILNYLVPEYQLGNDVIFIQHQTQNGLITETDLNFEEINQIFQVL